jgi:hypothetical protein
MSDVVKGINNTISTVFGVPMEMFRILPNSILMMSGLYSILTLSFPYAVFFGSLLEGLAVYTVFKNIALQLNVYDIVGQKPVKSGLCNAGLNGVSLNELVNSTSSVHIGFPSYSIFMICFASAYIFNMFRYVYDEITALGEPYPTRYTNSMIFLATLIAFTCVFRLLFGCEGIGVIVFSVILGVAAGVLVTMQNNTLFGKEGLNLLAIPILRGKAANGQPLYICPMTDNN